MHRRSILGMPQFGDLRLERRRTWVIDVTWPGAPGRKPNGKLRPIAMGDALRKLAMTLLCKVHREELDGFFTAPLKPGRVRRGRRGRRRRRRRGRRRRRRRG